MAQKPERQAAKQILRGAVGPRGAERLDFDDLVLPLRHRIEKWPPARLGVFRIVQRNRRAQRRCKSQMANASTGNAASLRSSIGRAATPSQP